MGGERQRRRRRRRSRRSRRTKGVIGRGVAIGEGVAVQTFSADSDMVDLTRTSPELPIRCRP